MDRLACINVAALPLQILLRIHPTWIHLPVAVVEDDRPQASVLYLNAQAHRAGIRSGQRYAAALALAGNLQAGTVSQPQIEDAVRSLTERLRRHSPHVEPASGMPGVFWVDVRGLDRLYSSLRVWADAVRAELHSMGMKAAVAVGFSRFGVYALAMAHPGTLVSEDAAQEQARVQKIPLDRLNLAPEVCDRLLMLGVITVGDFLHLPSEGIRTRFGPEIDEMYQLAMGNRWAPLRPVPAEKLHTRSIEFDEPESNAERLVFVIKRVLDGLVMTLARQASAAAGVSLEMKLQNRTVRTEYVRPAAATLDVPQLLQLIYLRLGTLQLSAGIVTLRVTIDACPAAVDQHRLFLEHNRDVDAANQALARVRAECGDQAVVRARICNAHSPAAQFVWEPLAQAPMGSAPRVVASRPLVRRIYAQPLRLPRSILETSVERKLGPYILSGGWWAGGVDRDYYFVQTHGGHIWWVYYDHQRACYFLQGQVE
jgi:protein ImuB